MNDRQWRDAILADADVLGPYCDWLEDQGRDVAGLRALLPLVQAGDTEAIGRLHTVLTIANSLEQIVPQLRAQVFGMISFRRKSA